MSVRNTTRWLMVCLYYNEPWEEFLIKGVKPYVDIVMQTGIVECFYFQRSWDRGPHIKLWFKSNSDIIDQMLKPNLEEHFQQYFESRPSFRKEPNYPLNFPENYKWHPNNSLQYEEHLYDGHQFGEAVVYSIAEKQYMASSKIVLESIKNHHNRWTYNDVLSTAMKMHLSLLYATGMDLEEMQMILQLLFEAWEPDSSKEISELEKSLKNYKKNQEIRSFEKAYLLQKSHLVPFVNALWESLENDHNLGQETYELWIRKNMNINIELGLVQEAGKINLNRLSTNISTEQLKDNQRQIWSIYATFIQLSNNRLGVIGKDEGYLFYALNECLIALKEKQRTNFKYATSQNS